ncbi:hypothetical protein [Prauserella cavernicola]|uniref:Mce-associated membrane protein n=1 Tax=Prauserella cavernicola TaxID=2800127 RepID=A0A934QRE1_9PSEU|nr:hypothetical protein [Prauserella cavernicola]MBK1784058.1 hypothetical protein [Prauserella cavernicola]
MSGSRRLPRSAQPSRRPRVAGLRKPGAPSPGPRPHGEPETTEPEGPDATEAAEATEAVAEPESPEAEDAAVADPERESAESEGTEVEDTGAAEPEATDQDTALAEPEASERTEGATDTKDAAAAAPEAAESAETAPERLDDEEQTESARPGPRRKARDTGAPKPVSEDDVTPDPEAPADQEQDSKREGRFRNSYALVGVLLVVGLLFAALAVFFQLRQSDASAQTENVALIDVAGTGQVKQAMSSAAERLFSVDYNDIPKNEKAADELLVNDEVRQQYEKFMGELKRLAPEQQLVVTVNATRSAVVMLDDDRAKVMVYIDQTAVRAADNQNSTGGAALWLTTEKRDGEWKVTDMNTYTSGQPTPAPQGEQGQQGEQQGGEGQPPEGN